jgi:tetratricopeptide (TPR) repeat protein
MLMTLLIRSNRFSDALSVYSQAQSRNLAGPDIQFLRALATWGAGDTTGARGILEELGNAGSNWKIFGALFQGKMLAFQGHIDESISAFRAGLEMVQTPDLYYWVPNFQYQIARAEIVKGDMSAAKTECDRFREDAEKTPTPINLQRAGSLSIQVGDLRSARHMAALLEERVRTHPDPFSQMEMHDLLGEVALASRRETEAKQELRSAITFRAWPTPFLSLAEACEAASDWQCAIDAYRRYIDFKGAVLRDDAAEDWTIAHYSLAHAYLKAGNLAAADSEYRQFRALFQSADPGLPILKEAAREFSAPAEAPAR